MLKRKEMVRDGDFGKLNFTSIIPGCTKADLRWNPVKKGKEPTFYKVEISSLRTGAGRIEETAEPGIVIKNLENGRDYRVKISAKYGRSEKYFAASRERLLRPGPVPGKVINYLHPEDKTFSESGQFLGSPSIALMQDGQYIASHDIFGTGKQNLTKLFLSQDGGATWDFLSDLKHCFWGQLYIHNSLLYMIALSAAYGSLVIRSSADGGRTWSEPLGIMKGGSFARGGPHTAPGPVVNFKGRIWKGIEFGSWKTGGHAAGHVSAQADSDLLDRRSWTVSAFLDYDASWPGAVKGRAPHFLEGNIVITPGGELVNILRYHTIGSSPPYGKAVVLDIDSENPWKAPTFRRIINFHGNMSKFSVKHDRCSGYYWSLVNRVTLPSFEQRNILTLVRSKDLIDWETVKDILNFQDNGWPENLGKVGFQYADFIFDGCDIAAVVRTSLNGANCFHDSNYITFYRVENFRRIQGNQ